MADLAAAKRLLRKPVTDRLRVVFVTEDSAAVLRAWLDRFDPSFVCLIDGGGSTSYVLNQLHLPQTVLTPTPATSSPGPTPSGYRVSHSGVVYVFAEHGTLIYTGGTTPRQYAADLTRLAA